VLQDATGEIKVSFKDQLCDAPASWNGKELLMLAKKGAKGWSGLKIVEEKFTGKDKKEHIACVLRVTPSAEILCGGKNLNDFADDAVQEDPVEQQDKPSVEEETEEEEVTPTAKAKTVTKTKATVQEDPEEDGTQGTESAEEILPNKPKNDAKYNEVLATKAVLKFLTRQSSLVRLSAEFQLQTILSFLNAHHTEPIPESDIVNYADAIAKEMTKTLFTTFLISMQRNDEAIARGNKETGVTLDTPFVPPLKFLNETLNAIRNEKK
jgi:hypothetical protein